MGVSGSQGLKKRLHDWSEKLKVAIPALSLAMKSSRTPWAAKLLAALAVIYALSPVDLIPDFIPVLGYLDDLLILPLLAAAAIRLIPPDVWQDCLEQAQELWSSGKPKRWFYAAPVVLVWLLLLGLVVWKVVT
jgi:uncharacterized membrane protein YkvA (DUF1232 family)